LFLFAKQEGINVSHIRLAANLVAQGYSVKEACRRVKGSGTFIACKIMLTQKEARQLKARAGKDCSRYIGEIVKAALRAESEDL